MKAQRVETLYMLISVSILTRFFSLAKSVDLQSGQSESKKSLVDPADHDSDIIVPVGGVADMEKSAA